MRLIDPISLKALGGTRPGDTITVWAMRGGRLVLPKPLDVIRWSGKDEAGDSVKVAQSLSFMVADPEGKLGAWKLDDPLGVAGTQLLVIYRIGGAGTVNFGKFRITSNEPDEYTEWRKVNEYGLEVPNSPLGPHVREVPITRAVVMLEAVDLTVNVDRDRLENPESPGAGATIISEFRRLTGDYFPTVVDDGVEDRGVSRKLVYDRERLEAAQDLLSRISARARMGGDGECHVYPRNTAPVLRVGPRNSLVKVQRKQELSGLYNRWIAEGKDQGDGTPIRGVATITTGPLAYGGDHGKAQFFYSSEMLETVGQARRYAEKLKAEAMAAIAVRLSVEIAPHPELQAGDRIEVGCPFGDRIVYMVGEVVGSAFGGAKVPTTTKLTVDCSYGDVLTALGRTEWADDLGSTMPVMTFDMLPGSWGELPPLTWDEL